ncbi:hypothetical protein [Arachidicoccus terrestris]|uniref:hypothetical protein n=1 Tax=Arachidicoccus terrestris TaxID=2875539 RepID=UPI001CC6211E|nr:hypothetical protein [Arachidicoccus terrestris]UAY54791.1 hypothetical protein K9M52_15285 [Arachidicoccus terrestris]
MYKIKRFMKGSGLLPFILIGILVAVLLSKLGIFNLFEGLGNTIKHLTNNQGAEVAKQNADAVHDKITSKVKITSYHQEQANIIANWINVTRYDFLSSDFWHRKTPPVYQQKVYDLIHTMPNADVAGIIAAYGARNLNERHSPVTGWLTDTPLTLPEQVEVSFTDPMLEKTSNVLSIALKYYG